MITEEKKDINQPLHEKRTKGVALTVKRDENKTFPHCTVNHPSF